ncbi:MerR family transcriptional regulator [Staphylococcus pseudintermedius]|nr:MerR family transcriptional regulator [Staphylococcus pseudintermedius]
MYTIKVVSELTGLSTRTLRYYDQIGLLNPSNSSEAGYRLYNEKDIAQLQQIMIYKNMQLPLGEIKAVLEEDTLIEDTLNMHLHYLEQQQQADCQTNQTHRKTTWRDRNDTRRKIQSVKSRCTLRN